MELITIFAALLVLATEAIYGNNDIGGFLSIYFFVP